MLYLNAKLWVTLRIGTHWVTLKDRALVSVIVFSRCAVMDSRGSGGGGVTGSKRGTRAARDVFVAAATQANSPHVR